MMTSSGTLADIIAALTVPEILLLAGLAIIGLFIVVQGITDQTETYTDPCGAKVELTPEAWKHIQQGHPEITDKNLIKQIVEGATSIMTDGLSNWYIKIINGEIFGVVANWDGGAWKIGTAMKFSFNWDSLLRKLGLRYSKYRERIDPELKQRYEEKFGVTPENIGC